MTNERFVSRDSKRALLIAEYNQIGEEIRYRDRIIHNSYYLLVIVFGIFAQATLNFLNTPRFILGAIILALSGGGAFLFLSAVIYVYNERRLEAMLRRFEIAREIEEEFDDIFQLQRILYPDLPSHRYRLWSNEAGGLMSIGPRAISHVIAFGAGGWIAFSVYLFLTQLLAMGWRIGGVLSLITWVMMCLLSVMLLKKIDINPDYKPDIVTSSRIDDSE